MSRAWTVMGVVNVTPDSFSDGGLWLDADAAVAHGVELYEQGAEILDIGGESTRPGAEPVTEAEELRRVVPVLDGLRERALGAVLSIDTSKLAVARAALDAGADLRQRRDRLPARPRARGARRGARRATAA